MNYIGCFNRLRDGLQVCSPFFFVWCLNAARCGVLPVAPLRRSCCASMLPGVECCTRAPFAPFLVPRCCQAWSVAAGAPVAPFLVPRCCQVWSVARCTFCARSGAPFAPTLLRYTYYSISQILEFLQPCPLLAARYRLYSISQRSGICEQI